MEMRNKFAIVLALGALALAPVNAQATTVVEGGAVVDVGNTLPDATDLWVSAPGRVLRRPLCDNPQIALSAKSRRAPRPARVGNAERASGMGR